MNHITEDAIEKEVCTSAPDLSADDVLVCSEPKVHNPFALWAIRRGLNVFMDKPLTAFVGLDGCAGLYPDFCNLIAAQSAAKVNVVISCERRLQAGYMVFFSF